MFCLKIKKMILNYALSSKGLFQIDNENKWVLSFSSVKSKYKYEILYCSVKHIESTVKPYQ